MRKPPTFVESIALRAGGLLLLGSGFLVGVAGVAFMKFLMQKDGSIVLLLLEGFAVMGVCGAVGSPMFKKGRNIFNRGRQLTVESAADLMRRDRRGYVLYLRSFADDASANSLTIIGEGVVTYGPLTTFEEQLVSELSFAGPVIAIGKPGEASPPMGAGRLYVTAEDWQPEVEKWMRAAAMVVFRIGISKGLNFELTRALTCISPERMVLLIPSNLKYGVYRGLVGHLFPKGLPEWVEPKDPPRDLMAVVTFSPQWEPSIVGFETGHVSEPRLRKTIRPIANRLGTPPSMETRIHAMSVRAATPLIGCLLIVVIGAMMPVLIWFVDLFFNN